jgi:hypothetical protein
MLLQYPRHPVAGAAAVEVACCAHQKRQQYRVGPRLLPVGAACVCRPLLLLLLLLV